MASRTLTVSIVGDAKDFNRAMRSVDDDAKRTSKSFNMLASAMKGLGVAAAGGAFVAFKKSAEAAIESEKANARLQAQLKASGLSFKAHEAEIERVIGAHSKLSGIDDEELGGAFTNIVRVTGDVTKSLKLTGLAADFARAKHVDVAKAGELVAKVAGGNTGILSRYGVTIKEGATATEALAEFQRKFAGQAEAYGKTTAGAVDRSHVALENLGETIGAQLTPAIARVAQGFSTFIDQLTTGEGPGGRVRDVLQQIGSVAGGVAGTMRDLVEGFRAGDTGARALAASGGAALAVFAGFKVATGVSAAVAGLTSRWDTLTKAVSKNPWIAVAGAVAATAGAIGVLSIKSSGASATTRELTDALRAQDDALRELRDIDIDVAQRKANVQSAYVGLQSALKRLDAVQKDNKSTALDLAQAEADVAQAQVAHRRAARELGDAEADATRKREDATAATRKADQTTRNLIGTKQREIDAIDGEIQKLTGLGRRNVDAAEKIEVHRARQEALRREIDRLKSKRITVDVRLDFNAAMNASPGSDRAQGDGPGLTERVRAGVQANGSRLFFSNFAGGFPIGALGGFSGGLMGARPELAPFAALGRRFGLGVSSGLRPGAITSSGNPSWHSSGEAIDVAGSQGGMLAYAQAVAGMFGGRLAELIHTPLGYSISHGQRTAPFATADHYDHVHVAMDVGRPGIGDGKGKKKPPPKKPAPAPKGPKVGKVIGQKIGLPPAKTGLIDIETAIALAALTEGSADDIAAARALVGLWERRLQQAHKSGNKARIRDAAQGLGSARGGLAQLAQAAAAAGEDVDTGDPNQSIIDAINAAAEAQRERDEHLKRLQEQRIELETEQIGNQRKILALANQGPQILAAVIAAIEGDIGGRVGLGFQTPGYAGSNARY